MMTSTALASKMVRDLVFVAHHAIHHMLMLKIIATRHVGIGEDELPVGFGRAPCTIWYDLGVSS